MQETVEKLSKWLKELNDYETPRVDYLPDINLYMDQVITYLERLLGPLSENTDDKIITSSMINNYVKGNVIPNPISKKYSRLHLIYILAVCSLKQVLPIADVSKIMKLSSDDSENYYQYDTFRVAQDNAIHSSSSMVLDQLEKINDNDAAEELTKLALELAVKANSFKMISERILYFLDQKHTKEIEEIKKKAQVDEQKKKELDEKKKEKK